MATYITRRKIGTAYHYFDDGERITDQAVIERINKLAILPARERATIARASSWLTRTASRYLNSAEP